MSLKDEAHRGAAIVLLRSATAGAPQRRQRHARLV